MSPRVVNICFVFKMVFIIFVYKLVREKKNIEKKEKFVTYKMLKYKIKKNYASNNITVSTKYDKYINEAR